MKQAVKSGYEELPNFLVVQNFVRSKNDYCFFSKIDCGTKLFVLSWVDDLVIAASSSEDKEQLQKSLETNFKTDDRGKLECFLGLQINEDSEKNNSRPGNFH